MAYHLNVMYHPPHVLDFRHCFQMMVGGTMQFSWHWIIFPLVIVELAATTMLEVRGEPILGPDLSTCQPYAEPPESSEMHSCCLQDRPIKDFVLPRNPALRMRRAIHTLDENDVRKYEKAYEIMRSLPATDPRSFVAQIELHCAYSGAYSQFNTTTQLDVHQGWMFLPFHRWLLYFHERILGSLLGDDTFGLPYWAWDVQQDTDPIANTYPSFFLNPNSSLYNVRNPYPDGTRIDLSLVEDNTMKNASYQRSVNLETMWRVMVDDVAVPDSFYGIKIEKGDWTPFPGPGSGTLSMAPHGSVHAWVGMDLLWLYSAARDTLFYAHHCQVDRLWLTYQESGGPMFDDRDWLDTEFLFYDENSDLVRVRIGDSLQLEKLGVRYEQAPMEWADYVPTSLGQKNLYITEELELSRPITY